MSNKEKILQALKNKKLIKVIAGIQNYDKQRALNVAMAAELGGATALDICDDKEIIKAARASVQLPLFVSSIDPQKLIKAQELQVDALEIGNYESFYSQSRLFTPKEILEIVKEVKSSLNKNVLLCCTVPATLEVKNQVKLASQLINIGVDILQTEGFSLETPASDRTDEVYNDILKAASTLANTFEIKKALPGVSIITASGITSNTASLAFALGASGVGVGTFINTLPSQVYMTEKVRELVESVNIFVKTLQETKKEFALH